MKLTDFDYHLPKNLIAQRPTSPRDHSRLLVLDRNKPTLAHRHFYNLADYLQPEDVLVFNDTKVFPARLIGHKQGTGGQMEVFLLKKQEIKKIRNSGIWEVLIGSRKKSVGQVIEFSRGLNCQIMEKIDNSVWLVKFNKSGGQFEKLVDQIGRVPIPPYIKLLETGYHKQALKNNYQTVYAKVRGSVAAPTAGFHFTKGLMAKLKKQRVQIEFLTLHVGLGTFEPVKEDNIKNHQMHSEFVSLSKSTAGRLNQAKKAGHRIIAVGTTTTRVLEAMADDKNHLKSGHGRISIFIYPGYKFKFIDAMITNFHVPKSTLIMLVAAFAGKKFVDKAYRIAIKKKYRFYSFGDVMLIL